MGLGGTGLIGLGGCGRGGWIGFGGTGLTGLGGCGRGGWIEGPPGLVGLTGAGFVTGLVG
jgi:hypothetical protein